MGYKLRREVADTLPSGLSSGERVVVLEYADQANDETRLAYGRQVIEIVARRSGLSDTKQVGKILGKLAKKGIELRVPITNDDGTPKRTAQGHLVYAYAGHQTTYRIPRFGAAARPQENDHGTDDGAPEAPPANTGDNEEVPPQGDHSPEYSSEEDPRQGDLPSGSGLPGGGASAESGPPPGTEWSPAGDRVVPRPGPNGPPSGGPFSSGSPQDSSPSPQSVVAGARGSEALAHLTASYGLTDEQAAIVWTGAQRMARNGHVDQPVPFLKAMAVEGTLARLVEAVQLAPAADADGQDDEHDAPPLRLVDEPAPHDRSVREAIAAAVPRGPHQPPLLASVDESADPPTAETATTATDGPDEARARRGADYARKLLAQRAAQSGAS